MSRKPSFKEERILWKKGLRNVVGIDEVGRGSFAGPVVAAAVVLPQNFKINGIKDSKMLSSKKREILSRYIIENANEYVISEVKTEYINKHGIGKATRKAFLDSIKKLKNRLDFVLVDGYKIKDIDYPQKGIIHGDSLSVSIAAASIIAKVYRDDLMTVYHKKYPEYNFSENKGYGTKLHRKAIKKYGLCKLHRTSFDLKKFL